jgi:hypothetical protein
MIETHDRAVNALLDVVAVEDVAPGLVRVVTWSDAYVVDARDAGCRCPDKQYNLTPDADCKHEHAAALATSDLPAPWDVTPSLDARPQPVATDGGTVAKSGEWTVRDRENDNERAFDSRAGAEDAIEDLESLGVDAELVPPGRSDGGTEPAVVEVEDPDAEPVPEEDMELPDRSVAEDPLNWVPGEFVDEIDGTQAINRKGFEVLSHFYDVDVHVDLEVPPEETDFEYCRVKATAVTAEGRECEAYGSAHVDRGDDPELLLEMADTRARKRALSIATGVGAVAVAELRNEVER